MGRWIGSGNLELSSHAGTTQERHPHPHLEEGSRQCRRPWRALHALLCADLTVGTAVTQPGGWGSGSDWLPVRQGQVEHFIAKGKATHLHAHSRGTP